MNWTELNWTELWTFRLAELELWTFIELNWTFWTELHACANCYCELVSDWRNCELLVEKHVKVIFCGEENVKKWFWGFFRAILPGLLGPNTKSRKWISICEIWNWREKTSNWSRKSLIFLNWSYFYDSSHFISVQFSSQFTWTVAKFKSSGQLGFWPWPKIQLFFMVDGHDFVRHTQNFLMNF